MPRCTITAKIIREHESASSSSYIFTELNSDMIGHSLHIDELTCLVTEDIVIETSDFPYFPLAIGETVSIDNGYVVAEARILEMIYHESRPVTDFHQTIDFRPHTDFLEDFNATSAGRALRESMQTLRESAEHDFTNSLFGRDTSASTCTVDQAEVRADRNFLAESRIDRHPQKRTHKKKRINKKYLKRYGRKSYHDNPEYWCNFDLYKPFTS